MGKFKTNPHTGKPDIAGLSEAEVQALIDASVVSDHGALTGLSDDDHPQYHNDTRGDLRYLQLTIVDTEAVILATSAAIKRIAYATDKGKFYLSDGANWKESSCYFTTKTALPDIGLTEENNRIGYGTDYVTDKFLSQCVIADNQRTVDGALKNVSGVFQIYNASTASFETIVKNFVLLEDVTTGKMYLLHKPIGRVDYISAANEDSVFALAENGIPNTQGGISDMGAYPYPQIVDGGTF